MLVVRHTHNRRSYLATLMIRTVSCRSRLRECATRYSNVKKKQFIRHLLLALPQVLRFRLSGFRNNPQCLLIKVWQISSIQILDAVTLVSGTFPCRRSGTQFRLGVGYESLAVS